MRYLLLCSALLFAMASTAQERDCARFKNGVFRIDDPMSGASTFIKRKGGYQYERMGDKEARLKVVWLNECTYTMQLMTKKKRDAENMRAAGFDPNMVVRVEILETGEDHYMQRSTSKQYDVVFESKVFKIK